MTQVPATNQPMYGEAAGFGDRLIAYIIDAVILIIVSVLLRVALGTPGAFLSFLFGIGYTVGFWAAMGATPGKMVMGLQVVRVDGEPLDFATAILRYVGYIVSSIPLALGFLWVLWDEHKQAWHDKIAKTQVVKGYHATPM